MNRGSDVFATLTWGLRRYAWLVAALVIIIGVLVPLGLAQRSPTYEARAQVGPSRALVLPNTNPLPRIAESVFNNGAVEQDIRDLLDQPQGNIIPSQVRLIAAQDNVVLEIVGSAKDAEHAIAIANEAASTFQIQLSNYNDSVAPFVVQHQAVQAKKVPKVAGGLLSVILGVVAGLVAGIGLVALILVLRRPVVDSAAAEDASGAPAIGRVSLTKKGGELAPKDLTGVGLLCRRILTTNPKVVYLAGPRPTQLRQLGGAMAAFMQRVSEARESSADENGENDEQDYLPTPGVVVLDGPSLELWARVPDDTSLTLLLAPEGIGSRRLRDLAEEHFTGTPAGVVLTTTHRRGRRSKAKTTPSTEGTGLSGSTATEVRRAKSNGKNRPNKQGNANKPRASTL